MYIFKMKMNILKKLYKFTYKARIVEEEIANRYKDGKMRCPTHLSIGQEAVSAALSLIIRKKDFSVSSHRAHLHYLANGGSLKRMIAEIYGKKTGCSRGKGGSMHLIDLSRNFMGSSAIVGNSIPIGVGLALSSIIKKQSSLTYVFFGDGATEEGVFFESINFALVKKLPVIFICENNLYSVYSPLKDRQPKNRRIYKMVQGMGLKRSYYLKSNDPYKIYNFLKNKIDSKNIRGGPYFFEFKTYRWREHCGPNFDNELKYRSLKEFNYWKKNDPIKKIKNRLKILSNDKILKIQSLIKKEVLEAFNFAEKSEFPHKHEAYKGVYAE